jgi:hypothetical protein
MITKSQSLIILRTFPWPEGIKPATRADISIARDPFGQAAFACVLFCEALPTGLGAVGAGSPDAAMRFAVEAWMMNQGVIEEVAHRLSMRLTN